MKGDLGEDTAGTIQVRVLLILSNTAVTVLFSNMIRPSLVNKFTKGQIASRGGVIFIPFHHIYPSF